MFFTIQAFQYSRHAELLDQMFRLRKQVFADQLNWEVSVQGDHETDRYDDMDPVYLVWTDASQTKLFGSLRLMPTTGPTLLHDVFERTFPADIGLSAPDIWEGTRLCIDAAAISGQYPDLDCSRAFGMLLLALCECGLSHGISTLISNYEPQLKRIYRRAGLQVQELGRADGYGKYPVCCGSFEVSDAVLQAMRVALHVSAPLLANPAAGTAAARAA